MAEIYKIFAENWRCDFSDDAALEMYAFESRGIGNVSVATKRENGLYNGFAAGKHWMDVTIKMWKEDIPKGLLFATELYQDAKFPHWFLKRIGIGLTEEQATVLRLLDVRANEPKPSITIETSSDEHDG